MIKNEDILLGYLEGILGKSKKTARNNYAFICPNGCVSPKHKLEINTETGQYQCWVCSGEKNGYKGKSLVRLLKQAKAPQNIIDEVKSLQVATHEYNHIPVDKPVEYITLPNEYKSLYNIESPNLIERHAIVYLKKRNIFQEDILKYNIGYCTSGKYKNRIIIPLYDDKGQLIYFEARAFDNNSLKYIKPELPRDIIPNEHFINWSVPIILCEGVFDMIAIKRNVIPLLGKNIQPELMKKIVTSQVRKVYICLDADATKKALQFCEELINNDKEVYLVEMLGKDAGDFGFENFTEYIQTIQPLTYSKLLEYKLNKK